MREVTTVLIERFGRDARSHTDCNRRTRNARLSQDRADIHAQPSF